MLSIVLALTALTFFYIYFKKKYSYWSSRGIPGPYPVPILGTFFSENFSTSIDVETKLFKKYGKVFGTYSGTIPVFNSCEPEHIKQILGDTDGFHNFGQFTYFDRYASRSGVFFMNGEKWRERRKVVSQHFTSKKLKSLLDRFETVSNNLINNIEELRKTSDVIDLREMTKFYSIDIISKYFYSIEVDTFQHHRKHTDYAKNALKVGDLNLIKYFLMNFIPDSLIRAFEINHFESAPMDAIGDILKKMMQQRDPNARFNDVIELLQENVKEGKINLTEDEIIGNCMVLFFAGTETTSQSVSSIFCFLIENPEVKERLYNELNDLFPDGKLSYEKLMECEYLDAVMNEGLRLGPSITSMDKLTTRDVILEKGNYKIEKGTPIMLNFYLNHINPEYFPDPYKFDPERFMDKSASNPNQINNSGVYLPFSAGKRQCLGMRLAIFFN